MMNLWGSPYRRGIKLGALAAAALVCLASCTAVIPVPAAPSGNSVILPENETESIRYWLAPEAEGTWNPADEDVAALEAGLLTFLQSAQHPNLQPDPPIWERAPDYYRQYLGLVEGDRRIIYANFFCEAHDMPWRTEFVMVLDGGDCFFTVKYDVERGEFYDLRVNGYA